MKSQEAIWDREYSLAPMKWRRERISVPTVIKGKNVLEVGVGNGKNIHFILAKKPKSLTAIDISSKAVELCVKSFKGKHLIFKKANICSTGFDDASFDVILCYYVLNNMPQRSRIKAMGEIYRILAKGGKVVFEDFSVGDARQKRKGKSTVVKDNGISCHFFTSREVKDLFSEFSSVSVNQKQFPFIKSKPNLKRKIISAVAKK